MPTTKVTNNVLASNAALNNLNAGASIAFTKPVSVSENFTVDTNTFFVDSVNNRVGIGTTSPAAGYSLDVTGAIRSTGNLLLQGNIVYLNSQQALTQGTNSLTLGAATYFTSLSYGNASTTQHTFNGSGITAATAAFTSTSRPTSAGTGEPEATSLVTRSDLAMEMMRQVAQVQILPTASMNYSSASGASAASQADGISLLSGTTANAYARAAVVRQITTSPGLSGNNNTCSVPVAFALGGFFAAPTDANSVIRFVVGEVGSGTPASATANALSARGWGFEIYWSAANSRVECRMFAHDGTSYTTSTAVALTTVSSLDRWNTFLATSDGAGTAKLFHAGSSQGAAPSRTASSPILTHTSPSSGTYGQAWSSLLCVNSASSAATQTIARVAQVRLHIGQIY